jgi:hypothetical protein
MVARLLLRWRVLRFLVWNRGIVSWGEARPLLRLCLSWLWLRARSGVGGTQEAGNHSGNLPPALFQMATGYWLSQAVYVAAKLGLADLLKDGPRSCQELAAETGTDPRCLFRLMRALSAACFRTHSRRSLCSSDGGQQPPKRCSWIAESHHNDAR